MNSSAIYVDSWKVNYVVVLNYEKGQTSYVARWKKDATEFPVGVNYVEGRGASSSIPKPIVEMLGNPKEIVFIVKGKRIEVKRGDKPS